MFKYIFKEVKNSIYKSTKCTFHRTDLTYSWEMIAMQSFLTLHRRN